jgi:hypothetical protein
MKCGEKKRLTVEQFADLSKQYFEDCKATDEPLTITGLALALGFASKQSIYDYSKDPEFQYVVGRAKMMVENGYEIKLSRDGSPTGAIFALKSFGWKDTISNEHSGPNGGAQEHKWQVEFINAETKD